MMIKDVQQYFISMQKQMNAADKALEKVNKEVEAGLVSAQQKDNFTTWYHNIKTNYDRLAYIIYLLHLPPKFIQKIKARKLLKEQEKFFKKIETATREAVEKENTESLDNMTKLIDDLPSLEESLNDK